MTSFQETACAAVQDADVERQVAEERAIVPLSLERAIVQRVGQRIRGLAVAPCNGELLVRGRVTTYYLKQLVIAAAMDFAVRENIGVAFDLEVTP